MKPKDHRYNDLKLLPLDFLIEVFRDTTLPLALRIEAAGHAARLEAAGARPPIEHRYDGEIRLTIRIEGLGPAVPSPRPNVQVTYDGSAEDHEPEPRMVGHA